jgi:hypothetical protein
MDLILRVKYENEWYDLDVDGNIPLRLDISMVENTDIGDLFGVGSQKFNLPGTRRNNKFFKGAYRVGADGVPTFYNSLDAEVLYNGESLLSGEITLEEVITDTNYIEYVVTVADETVQFKDTVEGLLISDVDFSDLDHIYNSSSVSQSWNGDLLDNKIFYPLCDFGTDNPDDYPTIPRVQMSPDYAFAEGSISSPTSPMEIRQFLPSISARTVVDKIFDQAGFKYESDLISGSTFDDLFILTKGQEAQGIVFSGSNEQTMNASKSNNQYIGDGSTQTIIYNTEISDPGDNYNPSTGEYTTPESGDYEVSAQVTVANPNAGGGPSGDDYQIIVKLLAGATVLDTEIELLDTGTFTTVNLSYAGNIAQSQALRVEVTFEVLFGDPSTILTVQSFNNSFRVNKAPVSYDGADVNMALQFDPKLKSYDLLKGILHQFNAIMVPEPGKNKTLRIENIETFFEQGRNVDWSNRYDEAVRIGISHPINEQPKTLLIKHKDDADRFSKLSIDNDPNYQYGTQRIIATSNIPTGEKKVESVFGPLIMGTMLESGSVDAEGNPTFNLTNRNLPVPHLYKFDNKAQKAYQFKPRLGYKVGPIDVSPAFDNGSTIFGLYIGEAIGGQLKYREYFTISNLKELPAKDDTIDLNFDKDYFNLIPGSYSPASQGKDAFEKYWKSYIDTLYWDENRKVTLDLKFSPTEYKDIRLNDKIIINGEQYRINKIKGFNLTRDDVVTVELLKHRPVDINIPNPGEITPTPEPTPVTPTPTVTPITPTPGPTNTPTPTPTQPVVSSTPTPTPTPEGQTPTPTPTVSPTPTPTVTQPGDCNFFEVINNDTVQTLGISYTRCQDGFTSYASVDADDSLNLCAIS